MQDLLYVLLTVAFLLSPRSRCGRSNASEAAMAFDLWLGGAVAFLLLAYLVFALLRPEKF